LICRRREAPASFFRFNFHVMKSFVVSAACLLASSLCLSAQPFSSAELEAIGRQDLTGQGTFHRIGLMRLQEDTVAFLGEVKERFSGQMRANTMLFASDNLFNTPDNEESGGQLAEFIGASARFAFTDALKLNTSYDAAFFRHTDDENEDSDFDTRTFRQQLSYERSFLDDKLSVDLPLSWQHSEVFAAGDSDALAKIWTYGTGVEISWFPNSYVLPSFSYDYFLSDPKVGAGKHKHDFNLGVTFVPLPGTKLFITPSVQYSHEEFKKSDRRDTAWTPTLAVSWEPLKFFAIDAVGSYTDSDSSEESARFDAITGTLFARLFWKW
jgi:hypothetical protein